MMAGFREALHWRHDSLSASSCSARMVHTPHDHHPAEPVGGGHLEVRMRACIDIGGTKVSVSLNSGAGLELLARRSEPTAKTGTNDALARQVLRMVDEACAETGVDPVTV